MNIARVTLAAVSLLAALPAQAALSGFYDSAAQIAVITADPLVADAVKQLPIEEISRTRTHEDGRVDWRIRTLRCTVTAQLEPRRRSTIGPVNWVLRSVSPCADTPSAP